MSNVKNIIVSWGIGLFLISLFCVNPALAKETPPQTSAAIAVIPRDIWKNYIARALDTKSLSELALTCRELAICAKEELALRQCMIASQKNLQPHLEKVLQDFKPRLDDALSKVSATKKPTLFDERDAYFVSLILLNDPLLPKTMMSSRVEMWPPHWNGEPGTFPSTNDIAYINRSTLVKDPGAFLASELLIYRRRFGAPQRADLSSADFSESIKEKTNAVAPIIRESREKIASIMNPVYEQCKGAQTKKTNLVKTKQSVEELKPALGGASDVSKTTLVKPPKR